MNTRLYVTAVAAFALALLATVVIAGALSMAYNDAAHTFTVQNETVPVNYTADVQVDPYNAPRSFRDNETVRNESGAVLDEGPASQGGDYSWNTSDGSIDWHRTNATAAGGTARISYSFWGNQRSAAETHGVLETIVPVLPWAFLVIIALAVAGLFVGLLPLSSVAMPGSGGRSR